ncbi:MAG: SAM-dependent methyltransferase [Neisseriaceae bacterium]|nr:MAG: SAM-dependent methyltransferase [Neisseriaceae bacterium]
MSAKNKQQNQQKTYDVLDGQSIDLLKELHILTRDGKINQDTRRKLKQVYHLYQFIKPIMEDIYSQKDNVTIIDHGAGKSYLGFILYDMFVNVEKKLATVYGVENRLELVEKSTKLAKQLKFDNMNFLHLNVADSITNETIPKDIDIVTALHACNTATNDAIDFALHHNAKHIVLVPCCQAELANILKKNRNSDTIDSALTKLWYHPIHSREFGSHLTNVLRILRLEAHGYNVTATELIGWEHSMKNELIIANKVKSHNPKAQKQLNELLAKFGLKSVTDRFKIYE